MTRSSRDRGTRPSSLMAALLFVVVLGGTALPGCASGETLPGIVLPREIEGLVIISEMRPRGRGNYLALIKREAERLGLPPEVADAVVHVESGYDPSAIGGVGEVGLMQIRPSTAAMLGFSGPISQLFDPETNVKYGVMYLAGAWRLAGGNLCGALAKYRAGHGETRISARSAAYCARANAHLASPGVQGGDTFAARYLGTLARQPIVAARLGPVQPGSTRVRRLWAEHAARVRQIEARVSRVMAGG